MLILGAHLSASKGYVHMLREAQSIDANTFQFFTRNPRGGAVKAQDPADVAAFCREHRLRTLVRCWLMHRIP